MKFEEKRQMFKVSIFPGDVFFKPITTSAEIQVEGWVAGFKGVLEGTPGAVLPGDRWAMSSGWPRKILPGAVCLGLLVIPHQRVVTSI